MMISFNISSSTSVISTFQRGWSLTLFAVLRANSRWRQKTEVLKDLFGLLCKLEEVFD